MLYVIFVVTLNFEQMSSKFDSLYTMFTYKASNVHSLYYIFAAKAHKQAYLTINHSYIIVLMLHAIKFIKLGKFMLSLSYSTY